MGAITDEHPFETMIPSLHKNPEIFYSMHAYPGMAPAWIVRRTEDLRAIYAYIHAMPPVTKAVETHPGFDPKVKQLLVSETK